MTTSAPLRNYFAPEDTWENVYPSILPQWDRTPRVASMDGVYVNATPEKFENHIRSGTVSDKGQAARTPHTLPQVVERVGRRQLCGTRHGVGARLHRCHTQCRALTLLTNIKMNDIKVSVIIPTYRPGDYLYECLGSLCRQTLGSGSFGDYRAQRLQRALFGRNKGVRCRQDAGASVCASCRPTAPESPMHATWLSMPPVANMWLSSTTTTGSPGYLADLMAEAAKGADVWRPMSPITTRPTAPAMTTISHAPSIAMPPVSVSHSCRHAVSSRRRAARLSVAKS